MMIPVTWMQYWKAVGMIAVLYYAIILALFFRNDIKCLLTANHRKKKQDTSPAPSEETTQA